MDAAREICRNLDLIEVQALVENRLLSCWAEATRRRDDTIVVETLQLAHIAGGEPVAPIAARTERADRYFAALLSGMLVRGPDAAAFGAFVATVGTGRLSGRQMLAAFALGCEVQVRFARALRDEDARGWDVRGVAGVLAASMTAALLLDGAPADVARAIGIASSMSLGQRESAGTMSAALIGGKAASNGVLAALLAIRGFSGPQLETPRGYGALFHVASTDEILAELGERWDLAASDSVAAEIDDLSPSLVRAVRGLASAPDARALLEAMTT